MKYKDFNGYKTIIFSGENPIDTYNDNVDVEVIFDNGERYTATFFTIANIQSLFNKNKMTGECDNGLYFWASDLIITETLSEDVIYHSIAELIKANEFYRSFSKIMDNSFST